jgi:hypothetical protein
MAQNAVSDSTSDWPKGGWEMRRLVTRTLTGIALALALTGLMAMPARADVIWLDTFFLDGPLGDPENEGEFIENETGSGPLTHLLKFDASTGCADGALNCSDGFIGALINESEAVIGWDLTGSGYEMAFILLKDGVVEGKHLYTLYGVTEDQRITSNGEQEVCFVNPEDGCFNKDISHISFFGVRGETVPEPTTLFLLGAGLLGTALLRRRIR